MNGDRSNSALKFKLPFIHLNIGIQICVNSALTPAGISPRLKKARIYRVWYAKALSHIHQLQSRIFHKSAGRNGQRHRQIRVDRCSYIVTDTRKQPLSCHSFIRIFTGSVERYLYAVCRVLLKKANAFFVQENSVRKNIDLNPHTVQMQIQLIKTGVGQTFPARQFRLHHTGILRLCHYTLPLVRHQ